MVPVFDPWSMLLGTDLQLLPPPTLLQAKQIQLSVFLWKVLQSLNPLCNPSLSPLLWLHFSLVLRSPALEYWERITSLCLLVTLLITVKDSLACFVIGHIESWGHIFGSSLTCFPLDFSSLFLKNFFPDSWP